MKRNVRTTTEGTPQRSKPPRILFIATDLSTGGGVNKAIRDQAILLNDELGADVSVVNARSNEPSTYPFPPQIPVQQHRRQSLGAYVLLLLRLRRLRPDVVVSSWTQDNILVTLAFLFSRSRVVLVEHTSWNFHTWFVRRLRRVIYPLAWRLIVLNPVELSHYRPFLTTKVRLLPNYIPAAPAPVENAREKLILAVGHLEPRKNFADAIRAMAKSGLEELGWSLAIVGGGPQENELRQLMDALALKQTAIHPPTQEIAAWYQRSSLTLVTSKLEVFSLVLAEAMLRGVVPIAYDADGPSFILEDFPDHLVPIGDVDVLAERLAHFAVRSALEPLRAQMRVAIQSRFSREVVGEQWRQLLSEALPCQ